jgi:hypothetical protein
MQPNLGAGPRPGFVPPQPGVAGGPTGMPPAPQGAPPMGAPPPGASGAMGMPQSQPPAMANQMALAQALRGGQQGGLRPISQGMSVQRPMAMGVR